jgi:glycosyltransferase involved in cell wall biosynthesis
LGKKILLFTDGFPYGNGEVFLEEEIRYLEKNNIPIVIIPVLDKGTKKRSIGKNIKVDNSLKKILSFFEKHIYILFPVILFNPLFWKEIRYNLKQINNTKKIRKLVANATFSYIIYRYIKWKYKNYLNPNTSLYTYWYYYATYGCTLIKNKYQVNLITRAHGYDIYQHKKRPNNYLPFRNFNIEENINTIHPISKNGANYLIKNQNIPKEKIIINYLGIQKHNYVADFSKENNTLKIVTCSSLSSVKRVDLMINNITKFCIKNPSQLIKWTHFGGGDLEDQLIKLTNKKFPPLKNMKFDYKGHVDNNKIHSFYRDHESDVFINTSSSEGIPVSIMEALSYGIPIIATNVGGTKEAVDKNNGLLLDVNFKYIDFENALIKIKRFKDRNRKYLIKNKCYEKFYAEKNYKEFYNNIIKH